jgi:hypothetical protein
VGQASGDQYQPWDDTSRPYADLPDRPSVGPYKGFTPAQRSKFLEANKARNGDGQVRSDLSGKVVREEDAQIDHVDPRSKGAPNSSRNAQVLAPDENNEKSDK